MPGYLKVELCGRLGKDPEMRYSQGGTPIANLSVACGYRSKKNGEWQEETEWVRVVAFGRMAEQAQFMKKGDHVVCLNGRLKTNEWVDKSGNKRYTTEVIANVLMKGEWHKAEEAPQQDFGDDRGNRAPQQQGGFDDQIPF